MESFNNMVMLTGEDVKNSPKLGWFIVHVLVHLGQERTIPSKNQAWQMDLAEASFNHI